MLRFNLGSVNALYGRVSAAPSSTSILLRNVTSSSSSSSSSVLATSSTAWMTTSARSTIASSSILKRPSLVSSSSCCLSTSSSSATSTMFLLPRNYQSQRHNVITDLVDKVTGKKKGPEVELQELVYDKETIHYTGKIFGVSVDSLFFYGKMLVIGLSVYLLVWTFFAGYQYLMSFSLAAVGRLGFIGGFWTCFILTNIAAQFRRRYAISPNAVYNQAIALTMKDKYVKDFLGEYPKTGDFRAYHASGGFKLPLLRRIRSGSYELADLFGTKPQRLQMMFILRSPGREALVSCDVRKMHTRLFSSSYNFKSLAVHLKDTKTKATESRVLLGRDEDVIYQGIMKF